MEPHRKRGTGRHGVMGRGTRAAARGRGPIIRSRHSPRPSEPRRGQQTGIFLRPESREKGTDTAQSSGIV